VIPAVAVASESLKISTRASQAVVKDVVLNAVLKASIIGVVILLILSESRVLASMSDSATAAPIRKAMRMKYFMVMTVFALLGTHR